MIIDQSHEPSVTFEMLAIEKIDEDGESPTKNNEGIRAQASSNKTPVINLRNIVANQNVVASESIITTHLRKSSRLKKKPQNFQPRTPKSASFRLHQRSILAKPQKRRERQPRPISPPYIPPTTPSNGLDHLYENAPSANMTPWPWKIKLAGARLVQRLGRKPLTSETTTTTQTFPPATRLKPRILENERQPASRKPSSSDTLWGETYYCPICKQLRTGSRDDYIDHLKQEHVAPKSITCTLCPPIDDSVGIKPSFGSLMQLLDHKKLCHMPAKSRINWSRCHLCNHSFSSEKYLNEHISKKHRLIRCPECRMTFRNYLKRCPLCEEKCLNPTQYKLHFAVKHQQNQARQVAAGQESRVQEKPSLKLPPPQQPRPPAQTHRPPFSSFLSSKSSGYNIKTTERRFTFVANRIHSNVPGAQSYPNPRPERLYAHWVPSVYCTVCHTKVATLENHLRLCRRKRLGAAIFCDDCGLRFNVYQKLCNHIKVEHLGPREYVCDHCSKGYQSHRGLMRHISQHHKKSRRGFWKIRKSRYPIVRLKRIEES